MQVAGYTLCISGPLAPHENTYENTLQMGLEIQLRIIPQVVQLSLAPQLNFPRSNRSQQDVDYYLHAL